MVTGLHANKKSLKALAEDVVLNWLPINRFYEICGERLVSTKRGEELLIDAKKNIENRRRIEAEQTEQMALWLLDGKGKLTAGRAIAYRGEQYFAGVNSDSIARMYAADDANRKGGR